MSKRPEFSTLEGENLEYIEANQVRVARLFPSFLNDPLTVLACSATQWPPKSYLAELAVYEKALKETDKDAKCICM